MTLEIIRGYLDVDESNEDVQIIKVDQVRDMQSAYELIKKEQDFLLECDEETVLILAGPYLKRINENTLLLKCEE